MPPPTNHNAGFTACLRRPTNAAASSPITPMKIAPAPMLSTVAISSVVAAEDVTGCNTGPASSVLMKLPQVGCNGARIVRRHAHVGH